MKSIMPAGYSKPATRKRLIAELTNARTHELKGASQQDQKRIHKQIEREADVKLNELYGKCSNLGSVLWSH